MRLFCGLLLYVRFEKENNVVFNNVVVDHVEIFSLAKLNTWS